MKLILILLLISPGIFARKFQITTLDSVNGMDLKFHLYDNTQLNDYAFLDCQSFFHKFDIYNKSEQLEFENYISISECRKIFDITLACLDKDGIKCVDTENIFSQDCHCTE